MIHLDGVVFPQISTKTSSDDIFQTAQYQILKHFSLMCFKGSFSKWRNRNYIHYI